MSNQQEVLIVAIDFGNLFTGINGQPFYHLPFSSYGHLPQSAILSRGEKKKLIS